MAVLVYFARDIVHISTAFFRDNLTARKAWNEQSYESKMGWFVIIGTLPIVTIGLVLKKIIESNLTKDVTLIAWTLIVLALVLLFAERIAKQARGFDAITWRDALIIGFAQTLALFPGASRSGTTITAGLFTGLKRDVAARFSFLLSIPAVLASGLLQLKQSLGFMNTQDLTTLVVATLVSGVSGYAAIALLIRYLQTHSTAVFVVYRVALGVALLTVWKSLF
jgi:undecaprenyl-diphosphatase